ncbi:hypothetical protein D9613_012258 [Agrocybe pediades]|uniref:Uncharacterized protein n=1 Tax=Agrocybe pediades TaxID=84607 RepID=A0A8H4QEY0_9AGAR|nr:hypothetical protein D9613_012258 [Agrocybe pediades]
MSNYYERHQHRIDSAYRGDLQAADEHGMHRSITRGSHQSHPSIAASTQSWIQYNHTHNLLPPEDSTPITSPAQRPYRPLPEQPQQYQQPHQFYQYGGRQDTIPEEDYPNDYSNAQMNGAGLHYNAYQHQDQGRDPQEVQAHSLPSQAYPSALQDRSKPAGRSFVGGFFTGLKRFPKIVLGGSSKEKSKRKGPFGPESDGNGTSPTISAAGMTRGNTLPRYLSNPSIGPSNPQFAHRLSRVPDGQGSLPDTPPPPFQFRNNPAGPQYPIVTVTPASDGIAEESQADFYDAPPADQDNFPSNNASTDRPRRAFNDRVTVIGYGQTESQAPTVMPTPAPAPPARLPTPGPRVSYQTQLPTRSTAAPARSESIDHHTAGHPPNPAIPAGGDITSPTGQRRRILNVRPARNDVISGQSTSNYTLSAAPSYYDPSFSSDLTPIEKFFKGLYNLPWIANERVTVDYRPGDSERARNKVKAMKKPKPMASWYRNVMSRSRRNSVDLLSNGTGATSPATSYGNPIPGALGSPMTEGGAHHHHHHHTYYTWGPRPKRHHHRRHRRHTTSTTNTDMAIPHQVPVPQGSAGSQFQQAMYPYGYPNYPNYPYVYPYTAMPDNQNQPSGSRSHKRKKTPKYANGYAPNYQPMPMSMPPMSNMPAITVPPHGIPPVFIIAPSPPGSHNGSDGAAQNPMFVPMPMQAPPNQATTGGVAGPSHSNNSSQQNQLPGAAPGGIIMQYVPGGYTLNDYHHPPFSQNPAMISPPLTPQRTVPVQVQQVPVQVANASRPS